MYSAYQWRALSGKDAFPLPSYSFIDKVHLCVSAAVTEECLYAHGVLSPKVEAIFF